MQAKAEKDLQAIEAKFKELDQSIVNILQIVIFRNLGLEQKLSQHI